MVEPEVFEGIKWITDAAIYDPFNWPLIVTVLGASGFTAASVWIAKHPDEYTSGVINGFIESFTVTKKDEELLDRVRTWAPGLI